MTQPNELVERRFEELQEKAAQQAVMAAHWKLRHEKAEAEANTLTYALQQSKGREQTWREKAKEYADTADTLREQLERVVEGLQTVLDYREGRKPYDFHRLPRDDRENATFDAWQEVETKVRAVLAKARAGA